MFSKWMMLVLYLFLNQMHVAFDRFTTKFTVMVVYLRLNLYDMVTNGIPWPKQILLL